MVHVLYGIGVVRRILFFLRPFTLPVPKFCGSNSRNLRVSATDHVPHGIHGIAPQPLPAPSPEYIVPESPADIPCPLWIKPNAYTVYRPASQRHCSPAPSGYRAVETSPPDPLAPISVGSDKRDGSPAYAASYSPPHPQSFLAAEPVP